MPQGELTYSLAEHAEVAADFTQAAFRLRPGLTFHDGHPLTTTDVKWTYENYKGVHARRFHDKLERIELVDDPHLIFHFKEPLLTFWSSIMASPLALAGLSPSTTTSKWEGRLQNPPPRGWAVQIRQPGSGVQMVFEAGGVLAPAPCHQDHYGQGHQRSGGAHGGPADRRVRSDYGMTGKLLSRVMADTKAALNRNFTPPGG